MLGCLSSSGAPAKSAEERTLDEQIVGLDAEALRLLLTTHLRPILDEVPASALAAALHSASAEQKAAKAKDALTACLLDLPSKKRELTRLFSLLDRDSKRNELVRGRSERESLMEDCVETICGHGWLTNIWRVGYEQRNWQEAHEALLWVAEMVDKVHSIQGGCQCIYTSMAHPIPITSAFRFARTEDGQLLPRTSFKTVKSFTLHNLSALPNILLWIWREVFVSLLTYGTAGQKAKVGNMLSEIEELLKWTSLERILYGGKRCPGLDDGDDEGDLGWDDDDFNDGDECYEDQDDDDDDWEDENGSEDMPPLEPLNAPVVPGTPRLARSMKPKPTPKVNLPRDKPPQGDYSDLPPLEPIASSRSGSSDSLPPPLEPISGALDHGFSRARTPPPPLQSVHDLSDEDDESTDSTDDDEKTDSEDNFDWNCNCALHSKHWPPSVNFQRATLRQIVVEKLLETFSRMPSIELFEAIIELAPLDEGDPPRVDYSIAKESFEDGRSGNSLVEKRLFGTLHELATATPHTFTAALEIHNSFASQNSARYLHTLLASHEHLITPSSILTYQRSLGIIAGLLSDKIPWVLERIEEGMVDCMCSVLHHVQRKGAFPSLASPPHLASLQAILKIKNGTPTRHSKIEDWVDLVSIPLPGSQPGGGAAAVNPANPIAFVGMMMGLPPGAFIGAGGDEDDEEYYGSGAGSPFNPYSEGDTDVEEDRRRGGEVTNDLRDEFRPRFKEAWEGWLGVLSTLHIHAGIERSLNNKGKGKEPVGKGDLIVKVVATSTKMYVKLAEIMPWFRAADVIDEMLGRIADKPSKHYVCDALDSFSSFSKAQRKKMAAVQANKKKKAEAAAKRTAGAPPAPSTSTTPGAGAASKPPLNVSGPAPKLKTTTFVNINPFATFSSPSSNANASASSSVPPPPPAPLASAPTPPASAAPRSFTPPTSTSLSSGFNFRVLNGVITSVPPPPPAVTSTSASAATLSTSSSSSGPSTSTVDGALSEAFRRYLGGMDDVD